MSDAPYPFGATFTRLSDAWYAADPGRNAARLAERLGVDASYVSHWRAGRYRPDVMANGAILAKMCEVFGLQGPAAGELYAALGVDVDPLIANP